MGSEAYSEFVAGGDKLSLRSLRAAARRRQQKQPAKSALTDAERRFAERRKTTAAVSHKKRVQSFNAKLAKQSDKNEMPRVDPRGGI